MADVLGADIFAMADREDDLLLSLTEAASISTIGAVTISGRKNATGNSITLDAISGFAAGQFVVLFGLNTGPANSSWQSPATSDYASNNGASAASLGHHNSLPSPTQQFTLNASRTRLRAYGFENASEIVDFSVDYGPAPLTPSLLDTTGKPRSVIVSLIQADGDANFVAPANMTDDGGFNGVNGWRRAVRDTPVGADSFQIDAWTKSGGVATDIVCVSIAVQ